MSYHTLTLPEDRCVRLLVKNLGRGMPESVAREVLESLGIHVQGVTQLRSGRRDLDRTKDRPPTPHCVENDSGAVLKALAASTPSVTRVTTQGFRYRLAFRMTYA